MPVCESCYSPPVDDNDYSAHSVLAAVTAGNPAPVTVAEQRLLGRVTGGNIDDLTVAQVKSLLDLEECMVFPAGDFVNATDGGQFPGRQRAFSPVIAGGAAGDHTVTGITVNDELIGVTRYVGAGVAVTDVADLTDEFTISDADEINNTGGTNTTGDKLVVSYMRRGGYNLTGLEFPAATDEKAAMPLLAFAGWSTVDIHIVGIASAFGSGTVRMAHANVGDFVDIEVAAFYVGPLDFPTGPTWSPGAGVFAGYKTAQLPLLRVGSHVNDDLNQGFCTLFVATAPGS